MDDREYTLEEIDREIADTNRLVQIATEGLGGLSKSVGIGLSLLLLTLILDDKMGSQFAKDFKAYLGIATICGLLTLVFHSLQGVAMWQQQRRLQTLYQEALTRKRLLRESEIRAVERSGWGALRSPFFWLKLVTSVGGIVVLGSAVGRHLGFLP